MLKLAWLGPPVAELDGVQIHFETRKVAALLAYLSLNPRGCSREKLAALFWPEFDQTHAMANLRRALGSLTRALSPDYFETNRESVRWIQNAHAELDVLKFQELIQAVRSHELEGGHDNRDQGLRACPACLERLETACEVCRGDFLDGLNLPDAPAFDEWQYLTRAELTRELAWALEHLAGAQLSQVAAGQVATGQPAWEKAAGVARRWLSLDRLEAGPHLALVQIYAQAGQRSLAQRQIEDYTRVFTEEFGDAPDAEALERFQQALNLGQPHRAVSNSLAGGPSAANPVLLKTKLYLPKVKPTRVSRPRLLSKLNEIGGYKLTLISAPAGFGKTSLLAEWAAQADLLVGWISLDSSDNDPHQFLSYLCAALEGLQEGVAGSAVSMLESAQPVPPKTILTMLLKGLEQAAEPLVIVLDDYQFISGQPIHEAVTYILERSPANLHLVIASRTDPPLPLARLRANGELLDVRTDDLRFNREECEAFFSHVMGLDLTTEGILALADRTEGWAVGLQMAGISLQGTANQAQFIQTFSGSHRYILEYLLQEVLDRQPEDVRSFLFNTSILDRLCCELCDQLCSEEINKHGINSASILEYLDRANLFLVPLDDERIWYRYHHLFADLLRSRLQKTLKAEEIAALQMRAAQWFEGYGLYHEAVQHTLAAKNYEQAAKLIEHHANSVLFVTGEVYTLSEWLAALPKEIFQAMPRLNLIQAWTAILQYREDSPTESLNIISQGIVGQSGSDYACYSGEIALIRGLFAEVRDRDIQVMRKQALLAWENLPERDKMLRSVAAWMLGSSYYYEGDNRNAIKYLQEAISLCRESGNNWVKVVSIADLSNAFREEGRLREAHNLLIQTRQELVSSGQRHPMLGLLYMNSGITLMQWNQAEEAEQQILHGIELFSQEVAGEIYFWGIALLVNAKLNQGKRAEAVQLALECLERLRAYPLPYVRLIIQASLVRIWIRLNDRERVEDWLNSCGISVEDTILYRHKGVYYSLAKALVWQGKSEEALQVLSKLYDLLSGLGQEGKLLLLLALKALAYQQMKETDLALDALKSSLKLAETEGFIRAFLDEGQPMEELLLLGMARGIWKQAGLEPFVTRLITAFQQEPQPLPVMIKPSE